MVSDIHQCGHEISGNFVDRFINISVHQISQNGAEPKVSIACAKCDCAAFAPKFSNGGYVCPRLPRVLVEWWLVPL